MPEDPSVQAVLDSLAVVPGVRWFHLSDPSSPALDKLAAHFGIHPLQVEDCRHRRQTSRLEEHERYTFVVVKVLGRNRREKRRTPRTSEASEDAPQPVPEKRGPASARLHFEDFDLFLGPDYLLTVDEGDCTLIETIKPRIAAEASLRGPDRIAHALIDAAVDQYLPALDHLGDIINQLEDLVIHNPTPATLRELFRMKRGLLDFRRVATGMREAVNGLVRRYDSTASTVRPEDRELRVFYRDVYDHIVRIIDFVETYRDLLTGSLDIYLSAVANRTNEVMKILTIWGTVALPLLILTSFYGMNVKLPGQDYRYMAEALIAGMVISGLAIVYYFKRKHWF